MHVCVCVHVCACVQAGDAVNVLAPITTHEDGTHHTTCDYTQGLVVLHPDVLLSGGASWAQVGF